MHVYGNSPIIKCWSKCGGSVNCAACARWQLPHVVLSVPSSSRPDGIILIHLESIEVHVKNSLWGHIHYFWQNTNMLQSIYYRKHSFKLSHMCHKVIIFLPILWSYSFTFLSYKGQKVKALGSINYWDAQWLTNGFWMITSCKGHWVYHPLMERSMITAMVAVHGVSCIHTVNSA